jgi:hypothetical protein
LPFYNNSDAKEGFLLHGFKNILISNNFCSKGEKAHCRKFEKLFSERDTDNGQAPKNSAAKSGKGNFPTENDYPENVEKGASKAGFSPIDLFFKRKSADTRDFETLDPGRNTDDSYAKQKPGKEPFSPEEKAPENEPEDVSKSFHISSTFFYVTASTPVNTFKFFYFIISYVFSKKFKNAKGLTKVNNW